MDKCLLLSLRQSRHFLNSTANVVISSSRYIHQNAEAAETPNPVKQKSSPTKVSEKYKIPIRIERSPTDILKALASTIGRDYTAPHYKFHDDPFLIPVSNVSKRSYALSKESGRKAAKWVRQQLPQLYYHKNADPAIMNFFPDPTVEDASEITEDTIKSFINLGLVNEATKAYDMMKDKGKQVSLDTKQSLLEILAFYNDSEPIDEDWTEEIWYQSSMSPRDRMKNTWKADNRAETLFAEILEMEPTDSRAYCALISARAKYFSVDKAWELFQEALAKDIKLNTRTFNFLIKIVNVLKEGSEMRWSLVEDLLVEMEKQGIQPNIGTLNAALECATFHGNTRHAKHVTLQLLAEFSRLGIEPSLASYYYLLITFCKERGPVSTILVDILNELEGKSLEIRDPKDVLFFLNAMDVCRNHLQDLEVADRVHQLLMTGRNYDLIGDSYKESIYYRHYMIMKINLEPLEQFFEFYDKIVPNIYSPEPAVIDELLKSIELVGAVHYVPQLFSDMIVFEHHTRENLLTSVLQIMANHFPVAEDEQAVTLGKKLGEIGWTIWDFVENQDMGRTNVVIWSGKMLGDLMTILIKSNNFKRATEVMKKLLAPNSRVLGVPSINALQLFLSQCIKENNATFALACIQYTSDAGFPEVSQMGQKAYEEVGLDAVQIARLSNIIGFDLLTSKAPTSEDALADKA